MTDQKKPMTNHLGVPLVNTEGWSYGYYPSTGHACRIFLSIQKYAELAGATQVQLEHMAWALIDVLDEEQRERVRRIAYSVFGADQQGRAASEMVEETSGAEFELPYIIFLAPWI